MAMVWLPWLARHEFMAVAAVARSPVSGSRAPMPTRPSRASHGRGMDGIGRGGGVEGGGERREVGKMGGGERGERGGRIGEVVAYLPAQAGEVGGGDDGVAGVVAVAEEKPERAGAGEPAGDDAGDALAGFGERGGGVSGSGEPGRLVLVHLCRGDKHGGNQRAVPDLRAAL